MAPQPAGSDSIDPKELTKKLQVIEALQNAEAPNASSAKDEVFALPSKGSAQAKKPPLAPAPSSQGQGKGDKSKTHQQSKQNKSRNKPIQPNAKQPTSQSKEVQESDSLSPKHAKTPPMYWYPPHNAHPHRRGPSRFLKVDDRDESPDSQVIASGDCTPGSEGIRRADRIDVHPWP